MQFGGVKRDRRHSSLADNTARMHAKSVTGLAVVIEGHRSGKGEVKGKFSLWEGRSEIKQININNKNVTTGRILSLAKRALMSLANPQNLVNAEWQLEGKRSERG